MNREEFAAKRRTDQDELIDRLLPIVTEALTHLNDDGEGHWYDDLIDAVRAAYAAVFHQEHGEHITLRAAMVRRIIAALNLIDEPLPTTAQSTATALSVAILNFATLDAAKAKDGVVMEWVTMHDSHVREAHRATDGQRRPIGEKFLVDGIRMTAPGDMTAPIELWINCRCVLQPTTESVTAASEKPWDGSASRFTPAQWKSSCVLHTCAGMEKSCHHLPIKEPGGALSRAGVHAAAGRVNQVHATPEQKASAKRALRGAYRQLGEEPPESLAADITGGTVDQPNEEIPVTEQVTETTDETTLPLAWHGVLAPEGVWSGDGRMFAPDSLTFRDLPLPLTWQKASAEGHDGSVVVGSIDTIERRDGLLVASGSFLPVPEADELVGLIAHFGKFGVSVDADDVVFAHEETDDGAMRTTFTSARICSASALPIPAYPQAFIALGAEEGTVAASSEFGRGPGWLTNPEDTKRLHDYWTVPGQPGYEKVNWGVPGDFNRCRVEVGSEIGESSPEKLRFINQICAQWHHDALGFWPGHPTSGETATFGDGEPGEALHLVAATTPVAPAEWFANPNLTEPTRLHVGEDGRVFGHIAEWGTCHVGFGDKICVEPPTSSSDYAYFHNGTVLTDAGPIAVGHLTVGGGHAGPRLSAAEALAHYDSTSTVVADVTCGDDEVGIWCAGWVRPGATDEQVYALRASAISGDWRTIGGNLELVIGHAVNSPGFPISRVAAGLQTSLVAAGVVQHQPDTPEQITERIADTLAERVAAALEARQHRREKMLALAARVHPEGGQ